MDTELAEHISLLAAPIYVGVLTPWISANQEISTEKLAQLRQVAIQQALALWLDTLDYGKEVSGG